MEPFSRRPIRTDPESPNYLPTIMRLAQSTLPVRSVSVPPSITLSDTASSSYCNASAVPSHHSDTRSLRAVIKSNESMSNLSKLFSCSEGLPDAGKTYRMSDENFVTSSEYGAIC
jgi:hypothetical protein